MGSIGNEKRRCRLEGFCDDAKLPVREVPLKSGFDQVRASASPVPQSPFPGKVAERYKPLPRLAP